MKIADKQFSITVDCLDDKAYLIEYTEYPTMKRHKVYCKDFKVFCFTFSLLLCETDVPWPVETMRVRA